MADLYNASAYRPSSASSTKDEHHQPSYPPSTNSLVYGLPATPSLPSSSASPLDMDHRDQDPSKSSSSEPPKMESKPQATFLTKLYALLERPEYQSMIRWDPNGEQIIVERPEQLALHVLPSIYRQSRFASFSRQLNIYGFMRKVNLRNVDPAIDDPDASTWSHPTLTRSSPPEVVANFKRRVPPRLPKQRKRSEAGTELPRLDIPPHQALPPHHHVPSNHQQLGGGIGLPTLPLNMGVPGDMKNRPRGLSAPGPYGMPMGGGMTPMQTPQSATFPSTGSKWGPATGMPGGPHPSSYGRNALPPIAIPTGSGSYGGGGGGPQSAYSQLSGISPHDDGSYGPASAASGYGNHHSTSSSTIPGLRDHNSVFAYNSYGGPNEPPTSASSNSGPGWASSYGLPPASSLTGGGSPSHGPTSGSLSSILNHSASSGSSAYSQRPSLNTATSFPSASYSSHAQHNANSLSPDSRPTTGYSVAPYDLDSATTASDSARPLTPGSLHRPSSAKSLVGPPSSQLSLRHGRPRRRSEAVGNPYPQPYYDGHGSINTDLRPVTAPSAGSDGGSLKGLHLPSVSVMDSWSGGQNSTTTGGAGDFAYSPTTQHPEGASDPWARGLRPSTSASSISAASTSMIHTPPIMEEHEGDANGTNGGPGRSHSISTPGSNDAGLDGDISRYATDFFPLSSTLNSHHGSESPDPLTAASSRSYRPISSLDGLKMSRFVHDSGLKPSDIDFGDPMRDAM